MTKIIKEAGVLALLSKDAIKADQDTIRVSLVALDGAIHANAVQCLLHAEKHGDTSLMTRLLVDIVGDKTGYRRQGLIQWMRAFSPMELAGKVINLSGTDGKGAKRAFLIAEANATPFWTSTKFKEIVKPVFLQTAVGKVDAMYREIMSAAENTVNGKPVDASKPFYDGLNMDKIVDFATKVKEMRDALPADETLAVRKAQAEQAKLGEFISANKDHVNKSDDQTTVVNKLDPNAGDQQLAQAVG